MIDAPLWLLGLLLLIVGTAAVIDVRSFTIPNAFPLAVLGLFVLGLFFSPIDLSGFGLHLASGVLGFAIGYGLFVFHLMGGGDVKLFAALSFWLPITMFHNFAVAVALAGGVLAAVVLAAVWVKRLASKDKDHPPLSKTRLPYGVAIFAGTLLVAYVGRVS